MVHIDPALRCEACTGKVCLIAICEKPGADTQTRFYQCANPYCRETYRSSVPITREREWIGLRQALEERKPGPY